MKTMMNPSYLSVSERRSLDELKNKVRESVADLATPKAQQPTESTLNIWGVPLLEDERTDVVLLKFLRARDFRVKESFEMLKKTLIWRREFEIDKLVEEEEDLGDGFVFMRGKDRDGHPVCYNVVFHNNKTVSVSWRRRIQFLERSIRKLLDFRPGGVNTIFQVNDMRNAHLPARRELSQALHLLQDNYPEFVAKQVFINVPWCLWWHVAFYTMMSPIMITQMTESKFVFVGASETTDTLFKYISPEQVPIQYGGLSVDLCECNPVFTIDDPAKIIYVTPPAKQSLYTFVSEKCTFHWELRVVGWEVTYSVEFVPVSKDAYDSIVIRKKTEMSPSDYPVVSGSFKISDPGAIVVKVTNITIKKKKVIYRYKKAVPYAD